MADLWRTVEGVGVEDGLDHDQALGHVLLVELVPVVGGLVGTVVEHLQELRPPQVEHELQRQREIMINQTEKYIGTELNDAKDKSMASIARVMREHSSLVGRGRSSR